MSKRNKREKNNYTDEEWDLIAKGRKINPKQKDKRRNVKQSRTNKTEKNIKILNFTVGIGTKTLICNASVSINHHQKYGVIGINGCGKSTLLRMICNREGEFASIPMFINMIYVSQVKPSNSTPLLVLIESDIELKWLMEEKSRLENIGLSDCDETNIDIYKRIKDIDGYKAEFRAKEILTKLGFD